MLSVILTPSLSRTSAEPHFEVTDLLPCLTTLMPNPARTMAVAVDMFKVCLPSPPVPQVSIEFTGTLTLINFFLKIFAEHKILL